MLVLLLYSSVVEVSAGVTEPPTEESAEPMSSCSCSTSMAQEAKNKVSALTSALTKLRGKKKVILHRRVHVAPSKKKKPIPLVKPKGVAIGTPSVPMPAAST